VVADDPRAATPLLLMYGRDVLDGGRLWKSRIPEYQQDYLALLRRLQREQGRRIVWLTSTKDVLAVYPPAIGATTPLTKPLEVTCRTVIHSSKAGQFAMKENHNRYQLHLWLPAE
jgi:hypothetical protein